MLLRRVTKRFLELHHVVGRKNDRSFTLALCFNCHALVTENLRGAGVTMERERDPRKFAQNVFRALAVHHQMLSNACWRFSNMVMSEDENIESGNGK